MKTNRTNPLLAILRRVLGTSALIAGLGTATYANTLYWDGTVADNPGEAWATAANWSTDAAGATDPGAAPTTGDDLIFNIAGATAASSLYLDGDQAAQSMTFHSPGGINFFGNSSGTTARMITLGAGGLTLSPGAGPVVLSAISSSFGTINFEINESQTWRNDSANQLSLFGNNATAMTIAAEEVLTFDGSGPIQVGPNGTTLANITGEGGIAKSGTGRLTLFNNGTYSGGTTLNAGTIAIGHAGALGTGGTLTVNGGTIRADATTARSLAGKLNGITVNSDLTLGDSVATGLLTFDGPINLGGATRTLMVNSSIILNSSDAGAITGSSGVGIIKNGPGVLTISGTQSHTFDGGLSVNSTQVTLSMGNMVNPVDLLANGIPVSLANASLLSISGKASTLATQALGDLTIGGGRNIVRTIAGGGGSFELTLGDTWTRNDSGALSIELNSSFGITAFANPALTNGIVGPWATLYQAAVPAAAYYATASGGNLVPLTSGDYFSSVAQSSGLTDMTGTINYDLTAVGADPEDSTPAAGFEGNTVRYAGTTSGTTLLGGAFSANGLMNAANTNSVAWTIGAGTLTIGSSRELVVNTATRPAPNANGMTINATIADNPAGASGLTVVGMNSIAGTHPAQLNLSATNSYTGRTVINASGTISDGQRTIIISALRDSAVESEFGAGSELVLSGAVIQTGATATSNRAITLMGTSGFYVKGEFAQTLAGSISGTGDLSTDGDFLSGGVGGTGNLILAGDNSFTGEMRFQTDGRVTLAHANALKNATLVMSGQRILADLATNNLAYHIGGLRGSVNLNLGSGGPGGLVSIGGNNQSNSYAGALSGSAGLSKTGTGTQTLLAAHTYMGATVIENGTLVLGATGVSAMTGNGGSGAVTISGLSSTAGLSVGQPVSGTGIATGARIVSIDSNTQVTVSAAHTGAVSGTLTFGYLAASITSPLVEIKAGASFDISANPAYSLGAGTTLKATGTATTAATLAGSAAGAVDFGSQPVELAYTPDNFSGDADSPALQVASGALTLDGALTVTNNSGTPLGAGSYTLIKVTGGTVTGAPTLAGATVGGSGTAAGTGGVIQVADGEVRLVVLPMTATTTTLTRHFSTSDTTTYGDTLHFVVSVSPSAAGGTVELRNGGAAGPVLGTATLFNGSAVISTQPDTLTAGSYDNLVAFYPGDGMAYAGSTSVALAPAQTVLPKTLTVSGAVADAKYFDGTTAATFSFDSLDGVITGDEAEITLNALGTFASTGPGVGIGVTANATVGGPKGGNYTVTQPTGLSATIHTHAIWTGDTEEFPWEWGTAENWNPLLVPNGAGVTADFSTIDLLGDDIVSLGSTPRTIGQMIFGDTEIETTAAGWTISGSTLTLAGGTTPTITVNELGVGKAVTIGSILAGANGFIKAGVGTLVVSGTNTYSGQTVISAGTLRMGAVAGVPTGSTIVLGDANSGSAMTTLQIASGIASPIQLGNAPDSAAVLDNAPGTTGTSGIASAINLNGRSLRLANSGAQLYNVNGRISGTGDLNVDTGTYALRMRLNSLTGNDFVGNLNLLSGGLQITDSVGNFDRNVIPDTADVNMSANTILGFAANEKFGALNGDATAIVGENYVTDGTTFTMTLGTNGNNGVFNGTIPLGDVGNAAARPNMPLAVVKTGTGTQVFNGPSQSTAATTINGGRLEINNTYTSPVTVAAPVAPATSAALGGTGNLTATAGVTATAAGSMIAPGKPTGALQAASANLAGSGTLEIHIDDTATDKCGVLEVTGALDIAGATLNVVVTGTAGEGTYVIARFGSLSETRFATVNKPSGYDVVYDTTANEIRLVKGGGYDTWAQAKISDPAKRGRDADADGDGFTNHQEFLFGKDPMASDGSLTTHERSGGNLVLRWNQRTSGVTYTLLESTTLASNSWTANTSATLENDGATFGDDASGFYQPRKATIPVAGARMLFRVEGTEAP